MTRASAAPQRTAGFLLNSRSHGVRLLQSAAVIVGTGDLEILIEPVKVGWFEHLRNDLLRRSTVQVSYRYKEAPPAASMPPVRAEIGRRALQRLNPAAA